MLDTVIKLAKKSLKDIWAWMLALAVFLAALITNVPAALLVVSAGIAGIAVKKAAALRKGDK